MFQYIFKNENKYVNRIDKFFGSNYYIFLVAIFTLFSEVFALEIPLYYFYVLFCLGIPFLFCKDMRALLPPLFFGYVSVSLKTNHYEAGKNLFNETTWPHFIFLISMIAVLLTSRLIVDNIARKNTRFPRLFIGYLLFMLIFPLSGIFSPYYAPRESLYGFLVGASYFIPFVAAYYAVDFRTLRKDYFAYLLLAFGFCLSAQVLVIYFQHMKDIFSGNFYNGLIRTGWGIKNNIGGMLAVALPGPIYLATKRKNYPLYIFFNLFFYIVVAMTESRGSLLAASIVELVMFVYFIILEKKKRIPVVICLLIFIGTAIAFLFTINHFFPSVLSYIVSTLKNLTFDGLSSGRAELWKIGIKNFITEPFLGRGYFNVPQDVNCGYLSPTFFPFRMHNTYIQLLSSTGIVGLLVYAYHRFESCLLIFRRISEEKVFLFFFFMCYLGCSAIDCHFFNLGPALLYAIMSALTEGNDIQMAIEERKRYLTQVSDCLK